MKIILVIATLLLAWCNARSQIVVHSGEIDSTKISVQTLDSIYPSGIVVFDTILEQFTLAHTDLLKRMNRFLTEKGFLWEQPSLMHTRMYFSPAGALDYYIYTTIPGQIKEDKQRQFEELLRQFFADYLFPIASPSGFSQCRPVMFQPPATDNSGE